MGSTCTSNKRDLKKIGAKRRARWSDEDLVAVIDCYDVGYKFSECCKKFNVPKSSLRHHLSGRTKSRKIGAKTILIRQEEGLIMEYMDNMLDIGMLPIPEMLKILKVAKICQDRYIPFKDGIPSDSWLYWFKQRYPKG